MTTNLFVIANENNCEPRQFSNLTAFFPNVFGCWRPKFDNF